jgi:crossover junction endodeoxyribonuclease RuvC
MRVLGIDPGSVRTGFGVVEQDGGRTRLVACGVIQAGRGPLAVRLARILEGVEGLIEQHRPDAVAVEDIFFARNAKSAAVLGQARGAALAAAGRAGAGVFEYSARRVKQTVTGNGGADKEQVRTMVRVSLGQAPEQTDASDALAVALCHLRWAAVPEAGGGR